MYFTRVSRVLLMLTTLGHILRHECYSIDDLQLEDTDGPYWWITKGSPFKRSFEYSNKQILTNNNPDSLSNQVDTHAPYAAPGYLPPAHITQTINCNGIGQVCVNKYICRNGFIDRDISIGAKQQCNADDEVCCSIREEPKSIQCNVKFGVCVPPETCNNGVLPVLHGVQRNEMNENCFKPNVCCRYSDLSPSPNHLSEQTVPTTQYPVQSSTALTNEGYAISIPENKHSPQQTPHTQRPSLFTNTRKPYHGNEYIPPQEVDATNSLPQYYKSADSLKTGMRGEDQKSQPINDIPNSIIGNPSSNRQSIVLPNSSKGVELSLPPTQCPAATNCTNIQFCTAQGVISKTPVLLSQDQEIYRVPLSDCRNLEQGFVGKCCRDPDYTDPWPVSILGQYNATILGFDDGSYKPSNLQKHTQPLGNPQPQPSASVRGQEQLSLPIALASPSNTQYSHTSFPQTKEVDISKQPMRSTPNQNYPIRDVTSSPLTCAPRNTNNLPSGDGPYDSAFGEFPWQAMVLKESSKSLLCGGAIIKEDTVLTSANCVYGQKPYDILVKGGEWKLGSDEEPKPFQTVRVKSISLHPQFKSFGRDIALLHLEIGLKFDNHIAPICIDEHFSEPITGNDKCLSTGWGKDALKYHASNAVMHQIPIQPMRANECTSLLSDFDDKVAVCGRPQVDACQIDSGSALACTGGNGQYLLKGIYSKENQCNSPAQIVTFAKMDVKWIQDNINIPKSSVIRKLDNGEGDEHNPLQIQKPQSTHLQPNVFGSQYQLQSTKAPSYLPPNH